MAMCHSDPKLKDFFMLQRGPRQLFFLGIKAFYDFFDQTGSKVGALD